MIFGGWGREDGDDNEVSWDIVFGILDCGEGVIGLEFEWGELEVKEGEVMDLCFLMG